MRAAAALLALLPTGVAAQTLCGPTDQLRAMLAGQFGERQVLVALLTAEVTAELWLRPDGKTFSWVQTTAGGGSCIVQVGTDWMAVPAAPPTPKGKPG